MCEREKNKERERVKSLGGVLKEGGRRIGGEGRENKRRIDGENVQG